MAKRKVNFDDESVQKKRRKLQACPDCGSDADVDSNLCTKCKQYYSTEAQKHLCSRCYIVEHGIASYLQSSSDKASTVPLSLKRPVQEMQTYVDGLKTYSPLADVAINLIAGYALDPFEFYLVPKERATRQAILNGWMLDNAESLKQTVRKLKFAIDKMDHAEFVDLLVRFQPWMSIKDALDILSPLNWSGSDDEQSGYKAIGLLHFVCDGGLDNGVHLEKIVSFCSNNGASATVCYRMHNFGEGCSVHWCGLQVMRYHPFNETDIILCKKYIPSAPPLRKEVLLSNMKQRYIQYE